MAGTDVLADDGVRVHAGWLQVRGGAGGTRANLADLDAAAGLVDRAADALDGARTDVRSLRWTVEDDAVWSPRTADAAHQALETFEHGPGGLVATVDRLRDTAQALRTTAGRYRAADADARRRFTWSVGSAFQQMGEHGPLGAVLALGLTRLALPGVAWGVLTKRLSPTALAEGVVAGASGLLLGLLPGRWRRTARPTTDAAQVVDRMLELVRPHTRLVVRETALPLTQAAAPPPTSVGDVLRDVGEQAGGPDAAVGVQRIDRADGTTSWVVTVPGTRSTGLLDGSDPADMGSNVALVGQRPDDVSELVVAAMREAGIQPGEPVLLAGHSQGGIAAMAVAADPALAEEFDVAAVVTAGSPVADVELPDGVEALHLEHAEDFVPSADGAANVQAPNRTTVTADLSAAPTAAGRAAAAGLTAPHELDAYAATADHLGALDDPSLERFTIATERVLGGQVEAVRTRTWTATRAPVVSPDGGTW